MHIVRLTGAAILALAAAAPGGAQPYPAGQPDRLMAERQATVPKTRPWPIEWFQPQEIIAGSVKRGAVPRARPRSISTAALAEARAYAMARGTQALLIWRDGKLEFAEFANGGTPAKRLNTYYMHLPVLTLLYGTAVRDGHIRSLDEPIGRYLPEWASDPRGAITIRQLLTMSAGLEMYFDNNKPEDKATRLFFGSDSTTPAFEYKAVEAPGKSYAYNYMIPELLGIVLERAIKERYVDYASKQLWKPIGNGDAAVWLDRPGGRPHFNSALFATAEDWLNVGKLIARNGKSDAGRQVVPASWIAQMKVPGVNPNYGMMWLGSPYARERRFAENVRYTMPSSAPYAADDLVLLDGYGGQRVYIVPSKQLVIVRIGATQRTDWDDAVLPNTILAGLR